MHSTFTNATAKQAFYILLALWIYISIGVSRNYVSLLFHQLSLPDTRIHLNEDETTWIATCVGLLSPIGSIIAGFFMDSIGRKRCVQLMFIPFIISWTTVSFSSSYSVLLIAMLIGSIGSGMGMCIITYVSEIAPSEYRGLLMAAVDLTFNFGGILCNLLMYSLKWYTVSIVFAICTCVSLLLAFFLPESPLWLYTKGKTIRALNTLCAIRGKEIHQLENEIKDLEKSRTTETEKTGVWQTIKNVLNGWRQFFIATVFFLLLILSGPMMLISYNVIILNTLKLSLDSAMIAVIYSITSFVGSLMTPYCVHKFKRKTLLTASSIGMTLCMLTVAIYEEIFFFNDEKPCAWIVPVGMCLFGMLSNMGVVPVGLVIGGEIFPIEARGAMQGLFGFFVTLSWSLSAKLYPLVLFGWGARTLIWCFVGFSALLASFSTFILPETKDKTLLEIQEQYFKKKKKIGNHA